MNHDFHHTRSNCLTCYLLTIGHPYPNTIPDCAGCNGHAFPRCLKTFPSNLTLYDFSNLDYGRLPQIV